MLLINKANALAFYEGSDPMKKKAPLFIIGLIFVYLIIYINDVKQFRKDHFPGSFGGISKTMKHKRYIKVEKR